MKMVLNKYLAHAGVCSRREAVEIIERGAVRVNGTVVKEPGYVVNLTDKVTYNNKPLVLEQFEYIVLNKPKGYVTTLSDERGRKTVLDLVKGASKKRIYPVGRLDINTTGLLLLTNDGELAQQLSHPKFDVKKVYQLTLNRPLSDKDFERIKKGLHLDDGMVRVSSLSSLKVDPKQVRITLTSGKNRIVRRIFNSLGYHVKKLDRIGYAGLSSKGLTPGQWRTLKTAEINKLPKKKS